MKFSQVVYECFIFIYFNSTQSVYDARWIFENYD